MKSELDTRKTGTADFSSLDKEETTSLFERARTAAELLPLSFYSTIVINGNCKADPPCHHCRWRSSAGLNSGFRRINSPEEIKNKAKTIKEAGAQRILLLSGWMGPDLPEYFYKNVAAIKEETSLEICGGFGYISKESLGLLKSAGMDSYFCGLEMPNEYLFKQIRPGDSYRGRLDTIRYAKQSGIKVWSGFIYGAGETKTDIACALKLFGELGVSVIYINPLVPSPNTEMEGANPPNLLEWSKTLAITRSMFPKLDIITKPEFTQWAFRAGANAYVHTPPEALAIERLKQTSLRIRTKPIEIIHDEYLKESR